MTDERAVFLKEGSITFLGSFLDKGLRYLFLAAVTYLVVPETFGSFVFVLSTISLLYGLTNMHLYRTISYYVPQFLDTDDHSRATSLITKVTIVTIFIGVVLTVIIGVFSQDISQLLNRPETARLFIFLSPIMLLYIVKDLQRELFRSTERVRYLVISQSILFPLIRLIITLLLLYLAAPLVALSGGVLIAWFVAVFIGAGLLYQMDIRFLTVSPKESVSTRSLLNYSLPLVGAKGVSRTVSNVDLILLGMMGSAAAPGLFKIGFSVAAISKMVSGMFKPISKPLYAKIGSGDSDSSLKDFYITTSRWNALIITPVAIYIASVPQALINLLFHSRYSEAAIVVSIVVVAMMFNTFTGNVAMLLEARGRTVERFIQSSSVLLVNLVLDILLIPRYGLLGAAIGTAAGILVGPLIALYFVAQELGTVPLTRSHAVSILIGGFSFLTIKMTVTQLGALQQVVVALLLIVILYPFGLVVLRGFKQTDVVVAKQIVYRIDDSIGYSPTPLLKFVELGTRK